MIQRVLGKVKKKKNTGVAVFNVKNDTVLEIKTILDAIDRTHRRKTILTNLIVYPEFTINMNLVGKRREKKSHIIIS